MGWCGKLAVMAAGLMMALGLASGGARGEDAPLTLSPLEEQAADWAVGFWALPVPPQGPPPETYPVLTSTTGADTCRLCHLGIYQQWETSRHALSMGPGVTAQLPGMNHGEQARCLGCHAPRSEQWPRLPGEKGWAENPVFSASQSRQGLDCAGCHLRGHRRHGPLPSLLAEGTPGGIRPRDASFLLHGEPFRTGFFSTSTYCRDCHQHQGGRKPDSPPPQNTYREWLDSPYPAQGVTCQGCHMPRREHRFSGIHDREFTRDALDFKVWTEPRQLNAGADMEAVLEVRNARVGHAFPTYSTPAVFLRAALLDARGEVIPGQFAEQALQRRLVFENSGWRELSDTRLLPGQKGRVRLRGPVPGQARRLMLWAWVEPGWHYRGFFQARLDADPRGPAAEQYKAALDKARDGAYMLFSTTIPVSGQSGKQP